MSTLVGYIPTKTTGKKTKIKAPELTPKQQAAAEARELGISLPNDLSRITETKIREMIDAEKARIAAEKAAAEEADATGEPENPEDIEDPEDTEDKEADEE